MSAIRITPKGLYKGSTFLEISKAVSMLAELKQFSDAQELVFDVNFQLKTKFATLVCVTNDLMFQTGRSDYEKLTPFSLEERALFDKQCDNMFSVNTRFSMMNFLLPKLAKKLSIDLNSWIFEEYVNMLDLYIGSIRSTLTSTGGYNVIEDQGASFQVYEYFETFRAIEIFREIQSSLQDSLRNVVDKQNQYYQLGRLFERFLQDKTNIRKDTVEGYQAKFNELFKLYPKTYDARNFTKKEMLEIKQMIMARRPSKSKKQLSSKTMNGYLSNYRTFFSWLVLHVDEITYNPFSNINFESNGNDVKRRSFTDNEVRALLDYEFQSRSEARCYRIDAQWAIKISLYSGLRLNEMTLLPLTAIKVIEGVHCFDLRGLEVKNDKSSRIVPIAQYLIDNGLLDRVEKLRKERKTFLFTQIRGNKRSPPKNNWGDGISKWFSRNVLRNIGIDKANEEKLGNTLVFHCTRRTVITQLVNCGAQVHLIKRLVGHSLDDDVTLTVYSDVNDIPLKLLKDMMDEHLNWHL